MKRPAFVLDACALIALINQESGHEIVLDLLSQAEQGKVSVSMHALNLCEVYYDCLRASGNKVAEKLLKTLQTMPVLIVTAIDIPLLKQAGEIKATERLSLADAVAVALAITNKAKLVSADHHELEPLERKQLVQICWFR